MSKKYEVIVFIGRFQPVHNAHVEILRRAGELANKVVIIIGSSEQPRDFKNPWTDNERAAMLINAVVPLSKQNGADYRIEKIVNTLYDDAGWAVRVQKAVAKYGIDEETAIIGHEKDESSFYLKMFPQWKYIHQDLIQPLNASQVREVYFSENCNMNWFAGVLPQATILFLKNFKDKPEYKQIVREKQFIETYKKQFENLPYPPIFVTVDAVVVQSGNVLLVKRKSEPGKGLWALPGGFVNAKSDKSIQSAMLRELKEETRIKLQDVILIRSIKQVKVFDAIDRSARGRTITHAHFIELQDGERNLPKVKCGDDAADAQWIPISQVKSEECFEDHYEILQYFLKV